MSSGGGSFLSDVGQGVGSVISDITGQSAVARTQGQIANAQLGQQRADRSQALSLAAPTDQQMTALQSMIDTNNTQISNSKALLDSVDPALIEAGKQALGLLQGKSAATLAPIQNQRSQQRQQLQATLAQQLGPDYATSTAGMQALNNFDQQTANLMTNAQQTTLAQLLGSSQSSAALGQSGLNSGIAGANNIIGAQGGMQSRQIGAILGTAIDPGQAYAGQLAQQTSNSTNMTALMQQIWNNKGSMSNMFGGSGGSTTASAPYAGQNALGSSSMVSQLGNMAASMPAL